MQIQIRINQEGALRNQRYAFSNRFTLVSELLQNARRAGAAEIKINHDPRAQILCVQDDGCGVDNFQKLLSFHESGWSADTREQEHPFGIGFSKCLYAATRCIVESGTQKVDIETTAALAGALIDVEPTEDDRCIAGTRVELHGVHLPELALQIGDLCAGFPVPVWFNGKSVERPLAEEHLAGQRTPIGNVHLAGTGDGQSSHDTWVFLQGFCVMRPDWPDRTGVNVVHLDPRQFMARLPDRDRLIDEDVQRRRIDAELMACWRRTLEAAKAALPPRKFVDTYYRVMRGWGQLDLLNDMDTLPAGLCSRITGYPVQVDHGGRGLLSALSDAPARADIESGAVQLVALDAVSDDNAALWMLARERGWLVFQWADLHEDHWVQKHVRFLEEKQAWVTPVGENLRTTLEGRWICPTVILCQAVRVQVDADAVLITHAGVAHRGTLYVPDAETTGAPVEQLSSFTNDNDQFLEDDLDADRDALADLLQRLRAVDPVQTLESLLKPLRLGRYPLLHGRAFHLTVGVGALPGHTVALVDAISAEDRHAAG